MSRAGASILVSGDDAGPVLKGWKSKGLLTHYRNGAEHGGTHGGLEFIRGKWMESLRLAWVQ